MKILFRDFPIFFILTSPNLRVFETILQGDQGFQNFRQLSQKHIYILLSFKVMLHCLLLLFQLCCSHYHCVCSIPIVFNHHHLSPLLFDSTFSIPASAQELYNDPKFDLHHPQYVIILKNNSQQFLRFLDRWIW